jgi:autotransporter translocation and assembly factor TamB
VLRLAVDEDTPAMTGGLKLRAKFELPPGHVDAMQKLLLNGSFQIDDARFTSGGIQAKVNDLSQKAQADKGPPEEVLSDFSGKFTMSGGVIRFSTVTFSMPGAHVTLAGSYAGKTQALDFRGTVRMEAKLSQMTSGFKSALLKVIEPVFRHKGATVIPITIGGTAKEPKFGLDVARAFTPR